MSRLSYILNGNTSQVDVYAILDYSLYKYAPSFFKSWVNNDNNWRIQTLAAPVVEEAKNAKKLSRVRPLFLDELIIELLETKLTTTDIPPQFRFLHFNLPHNPARYDQECVKLEFESNDWQRLRIRVVVPNFCRRILEKLTNWRLR